MIIIVITLAVCASQVDFFPSFLNHPSWSLDDELWWVNSHTHIIKATYTLTPADEACLYAYTLIQVFVGTRLRGDLRCYAFVLPGVPRSVRTY